MADAVVRARQIAKSVIGGQYDPLLACRELVDIRGELPAVMDDVMDVFVAVDSECDGWPLGPERAHWTTESLREKDLHADAYRTQVHSIVVEALKGLLDAIGNESHS